jgi:hypothetical protein
LVNFNRSFTYKFFKLLMILWLIHPDFLGAFYLYHQTNERFFEKHKDSFLEKMYQRVATLAGFSHKFLDKLQSFNAQANSGSGPRSKNPYVLSGKDSHAN